MNLPLYQHAALRLRFPEYNFTQGDVATLLDYVAHLGGGERGCVVKVFDAIEGSIAVVVVRESGIEGFRADEALPSVISREVQ